MTIPGSSQVSLMPCKDSCRGQLQRKGIAYEAIVLGQQYSDTSVYLANRQGDQHIER